MLTLTPNSRLSRTLLQLYALEQLDKGHASWHTPDILPLNAWLQKLWSQFCLQSFDNHPYLLNPEQEQFIWEKILVHTKNADQLLQIYETADLVRSAYYLLKQWRVDINQSIFQTAEDYVALVNWIKEYQTICKNNHWIDTASLPEILENKISLPKHIKLNGFTEISPQIKYFLRNSELEFINCEQACESSARISLETADEELLTMARWAESIYAKDKNARIACVFPDLATNRDRVAQVFGEIFVNEEAFNISAGKPLIQYPIIDTAINLLNLYKKKTTATIFSYLLTSPFLGDAEYERGKRSALDVYLRKENITDIQLDFIADILNKFTPKLANKITNFFEQLTTLPEVQSYQAWAYSFNQLLSILGWPGERSLSSIEYQIVDSWLDLLYRFSALDQVTGPTNFKEALSVLQKMTAKAVFQPKTPPASVQILGVLEAAGMPFDHVWISGMNDISWPPAPSPNPFIPKSVQRELNMPHATAEREHLFCNSLLQQFKACSSRIIFSHARRADDLEFKVSPLIHVEHELFLDDLNLNSYFSFIQRVFLASNLTTMIDNQAPPMKEEKMAGGVSIIKYQAECPFRAFAQWRLHARELESTSPGLRARDRGNAIHKALEVIWGKIGSYYNLQQLTENELQQLIFDAIDVAMQSFPNSHRNFKQYLSLEKSRLQKILNDWLAIEKLRPPFKVLQNEVKLEYKLQKLTINVRIDRIDELVDGKKLIIDYKTGYSSVNSWFEHRLDEPQLPLYALIDPSNTIGISFAQVTAGEHSFKGVSQYDLEIKGIKEVSSHKKAAMSWQEQINVWQQSLAQLADDFCNGKANVDPKDEEQTCAFCALEPLCRKNEEIAL